MRILRQPAPIHTAFNPVMVELESTLEVETSAIVTVIYNGKQYPQYREYFNGKTLFDLSGILKKLFISNESDTTIDTSYTYIDTLFAIGYSIMIETGGTVYNIDNMTAVNSVVQIGYSSNMFGDRFLTGFSKLRKYEGYPLSVAYLNNQKSTYISFNRVTINPDNPVVNSHFIIDVPEDVYEVSATEMSFIAPLLNNEGIPILTNAGEVIYVSSHNGSLEYIRIPVKEECVPLNPFYVRWINRLGSWEYWMFSFRQLITKDIDNIETFNPLIYDQETAKGFLKVISMTGEETIVFGASGLSKDEYTVISNLIYSPQVEFYDKDLGKWFELNPSGMNQEEDTKLAGKSVEFEMLLPTPQLQY